MSINPTNADSNVNPEISLDRLDDTLAWLDSNLPAFDPLPRGLPDDYGLKIFAELSITFLYLSESTLDIAGPHPAISSFLSKCSEFLKFQCGRAEYLEAARRDPLNAYSFALPYLALRSLEYRSAPFESLLDWLCELKLPRSIEVVPYRDWDRQHFLYKSKYIAKLPSFPVLYRNTTLARRTNSIYYSESDAYAATHTIFYMTDFGHCMPSLSAKELAGIDLLLQSLLVHFWRTRNWDVMGELLTCFNYLKLPISSQVQQAAAAFNGLLRPDGTVPAHPPRRSRCVRVQRKHLRSSAIDQYFRTCYHTTLVWILYVLSAAK